MVKHNDPYTCKNPICGTDIVDKTFSGLNSGYCIFCAPTLRSIANPSHSDYQHAVDRRRKHNEKVAQTQQLIKELEDLSDQLSLKTLSDEGFRKNLREKLGFAQGEMIDANTHQTFKDRIAVVAHKVLKREDPLFEHAKRQEGYDPSKLSLKGPFSPSYDFYVNLTRSHEKETIEWICAKTLVHYFSPHKRDEIIQSIL